mmetsp:Transcript_26723/g.58094  ORF Transcript_26723/g.58094 Transcript_26723/m.58094 type:complete len:93 (-) Transcript_26723:37-315(-)
MGMARPHGVLSPPAANSSDSPDNWATVRILAVETADTSASNLKGAILLDQQRRSGLREAKKCEVFQTKTQGLRSRNSRAAWRLLLLSVVCRW